jgi:membrane-bound lytic murein transglycosylase A
MQSTAATTCRGLAAIAFLVVSAAAFPMMAAAQGSEPSGNDAATQPRATSGMAERTPFRTRYAYFVPARFTDLPGWDSDNVTDAWNAFRASCGVLANRSAWAGPCERARRVRERDEEIRAFLEREFTLYQIHDNNFSPAGVITGYYEPLLNGSREYGGRYVYPVYGVPEDLLYLDSRNLPRMGAGDGARAAIDGRAVVPCAGADCRGAFKLDLGDIKPDVRDKRIRVRVDGDRIVPYYTRAEIEQGALSRMPVIVWVDDVAALYAMHVQGSGKVRLPDGRIVRLAFAEQNGHPFLPPIQSIAKRKSTRPAPLLTRGIDIPLADDDDDALPRDFSRSDVPVLRGGGAPPATVTTREPRSGVAQPEPELDPEVARMVELLLKGNEGAIGRPSASSTPATAAAAPAAAASPRAEPKSAASTTVASAPPPAVVADAKPAGPSRYSSDPSYVFFRQIPDGDGGPIGALGVPLTPGRSVAVDPRTTPLGYPVFISTVGPSSTVNRLMLAQDTGGAIRGAVRADYFWGFGAGAGERASRMKENGRMWLLVPRDLELAAGTGVVTRGGVRSSDTDCVVPDPELCVE